MKLSALKKANLKVFSTTEASRLGITPQHLAYYLKKNLIERVSHGVYRLAGESSIDFESLIAEKLKSAPQGIIGFKTALRLYGLTEDVPGEIDLIVPASNVPKAKLEDVALHPVTDALYKKEIRKIHRFRVTSIERTLIDLLRSGEPMSLIVNICREAKSKRIAISLTKLKALARPFRAKQKVARLIEVLL